MTISDFKPTTELSSSKGITKIDPISIPGFGPSSPSDVFNPNNHTVKYIKVDFDDLGALCELQILETRALRNQGIYILSKEKYTCMEKYFLVVGYLETGVNS